MSVYRWYICPEPHEPLVLPDRDCPEVNRHTPQPASYLGWMHWASSMYGQGARQIRCPGCGKLNIWVGSHRALKERS